MTPFTLTEWREHEARIDASQPREGLPLLSRLSPEFVQALTPAEALALKYEPAAYLRPSQMIDDSANWLNWIFMTGRGWGKSLGCAAWLAGRILAKDAGDYTLLAPTIEDARRLQWHVLRDRVLPPWVRYVERMQRDQVHFPDHGVTLTLRSAKVTEFRGPNLRGAWCEEPIVWSRGETLWENFRKSVRVDGPTPARVVVATTPPEDFSWLLELCARPSSRVVRGRMRDNPTLSQENVDDEYSRAGSRKARRELDGEVVLGVDGALFALDDLEDARVDAAPELDAVVIAVDPAQSAASTADTVGVAALGIARGHLYVLESVSEHMTPEQWSERAMGMAADYDAGRYVVEVTGAGEAPRAILNQAMRLVPDAPHLPIVSAKTGARSKADRAQPLAHACARGRLHLVGRNHAALERELTTWHPGAGWSPGALDALVHGAAVITTNWKALQ